ncbi:ataxin-1-like [Ambystoma mexicanum]|uniref:ataxin-1-like n=1 Tax=Ambystoma mexicanum TaxID=8296 RepID=UPI0037E786CC
MKPAHERNQECLPPKKRDLPQSTEEPTRPANVSVNDSQLSDAGEWPRGVMVAAGQGQVGLRYGDGGEALTGVTVDQYGNLYRVAVPAGNLSSSALHPVVNMSPLSHPFSVGAPVMQHPGISYSPIQYAPLSHTSVQFIGSYAVPYAMPPGFLSSPLVSPPVTLAPSHIPHYVPYNSILSDGTTPPPQTSSHSLTFNKASSATHTAATPAGQLQHHANTLPLAMTQGRVPIYYHTNARIPATYELHEEPLCPESPAENSKERSPLTVIPPNGGQREQICNQGRKANQTMEIHSRETEDYAPGSTVDSVMNLQVFQGYQTRGEVAVPAHRGTPDTDLEVQRVVSGLASQDYHSLLVQKKDASSPLNLSQHVTENQGGRRNLSAHHTQINPSEPIVERGQLKHLYTSPFEQGSHEQLQRAMVIANGETLLVPLSAAQGLVSSASDLTKGNLGSKTHERQATDLPTKEMSFSAAAPTPLQPALVQPPAPSPLPSHFMKGAIIQLATGELKRVEELQTQDFIRSAEVSGGLKIDSSTVVDIQESQWPGFVTLHFMVGEQQNKVTLDVPPEHPFFVYGQGWSSCNPEQTTHLFALPCHRLQVGDVCISISLQNCSEELASTSECPLTGHSPPKERTVQHPREQAPPLDMNSEKKGYTPRDSMARSSHTEASSSALCNPHCWPDPAPGFQRYNVQAEGRRSSPARPSFIPQEVKLSIEGRSNAGK